jgi:tetratricopeptide (TPR) repeat protein
MSDKRIIGILILFSIIFVHNAFSEVPPPASVRAVQCGAFPTQEEADLCMTSLENLGYGPVWKRDDPDYIRVLVGICDNYTDAHILKMSLRENGFPDAFIQSYPEMVTPNLVPAMNLHDPQPFSSPNSKYPNNDNFDPSTRNESALIIQSKDKGEMNTIIQEGSIMINTLNESDPLRGWVMVEVAGALVARDKKVDMALPYLNKVARNETAAGKNDVIRSRFMVADCKHYYVFEPLETYKMYKYILENHGDNTGIRARAMVEIAACSLELARSQKAYYDEVRRNCRKIIETLPVSYKRAHAVADLIYCETYMYEGKREEGIQAFQGFENRHPGRIREIAMANQLQGFLYGKLNNWEKCREFYERNFSLDLSSPKEMFSFGGEPWNLKERACKWLHVYAAIFHDDPRVQLYKSYLDTEHFKMSSDLSNANYAFFSAFYEESE